jgi:hypothetical protein
MHNPYKRPFFCAENTIMANIYWDMWLFLSFHNWWHWTQRQTYIFFQQDGARLHLGHKVWNSLNFVFSNSRQDEANTVAPMTSRCLTNGLFSVGIYNKSPLYRENLRFTSSARWIDTSTLRVEMPQQTRPEIEYHLYVCRVQNGMHIVTF